VLEELGERVLTSLSAQSLVSAAVSPGEADIFMSTSWNPLSENSENKRGLKFWNNGVSERFESTQIYWLSSTLLRFSFQHPVFSHSTLVHVCVLVHVCPCGPLSQCYESVYGLHSRARTWRSRPTTNQAARMYRVNKKCRLQHVFNVSNRLARIGSV
jgi:hypothetical protein